MSPHYIAGRAAFFSGKRPCNTDPREVVGIYDTLTKPQRSECDGWFDARDDQRKAYIAMTAQ